MDRLIIPFKKPKIDLKTCLCDYEEYKGTDSVIAILPETKKLNDDDEIKIIRYLPTSTSLANQIQRFVEKRKHVLLANHFLFNKNKSIVSCTDKMRVISCFSVNEWYSDTINAIENFSANLNAILFFPLLTNESLKTALKLNCQVILPMGAFELIDNKKETMYFVNYEYSAPKKHSDRNLLDYNAGILLGGYFLTDEVNHYINVMSNIMKKDIYTF